MLQFRRIWKFFGTRLEHRVSNIRHIQGRNQINARSLLRDMTRLFLFLMHRNTSSRKDHQSSLGAALRVSRHE